MSTAPAQGAQRSLLRLAAPLVVSFWMRSLFTFVDTFYAATLSDAAIAAIGLTIPLEFIFIATWVGLSNALTSHLSKAMGKNDNEGFDRHLVAIGLILCLVVPLFALMAIGLYFAAPSLGLELQTMREFQIYGTILIGGTAALGFWSILPDSIIKAHHDTRTTMVAGILSNIVNVTLNTLFLFAFHWGIFGIAFSTVLGRLGGLLYAVWKAAALERARRGTSLGAAIRFQSVGKKSIWLLLKLAIPSSMAYLLMATEGGLVNLFLSNSEHSTAALAAYSIYYRVSMFSVMPIIAVGVAMLPFVARHAGEGNLEIVRDGLRKGLGTGALYTILIVGPACLLGAKPLLAFLAEAPETTAYGIFAMQITPVAVLAAIPFLLCRPVFEGLQQGRPVVIAALLRYVFLAPPLALAGMSLGRRFGASAFEGLLLGLLLATTIVSALFLAWTRRILRR